MDARGEPLTRPRRGLPRQPRRELRIKDDVGSHVDHDAEEVLEGTLENDVAHSVTSQTVQGMTSRPPGGGRRLLRRGADDVEGHAVYAFA